MPAEPDLTLHALYASVVEDEEEGLLFIGFAEGEDEEEPYLLFRQPVAGGPVWFEIGDEAFGAEDALDSVRETSKGLLLTVRPAARAALGFVATIDLRLGTDCEDADPAVAALREMLGAAFFA
ncbi:hypothetical protein [Neotabrizicola sp. sgz301269]|uniref:hypothetical protein n=1 Tax=Neotabrizicola sp. sgz301269 TaxID=3276282 RepID=UPI00376FF4AC